MALQRRVDTDPGGIDQLRVALEKASNPKTTIGVLNLVVLASSLRPVADWVGLGSLVHRREVLQTGIEGLLRSAGKPLGGHEGMIHAPGYSWLRLRMVCMLLGIGAYEPLGATESIQAMGHGASAWLVGSVVSTMAQ